MKNVILNIIYSMKVHTESDVICVNKNIAIYLT